MRTAEEVTAPIRMSGGIAGGVPPMVWVACPNSECRAFGIQRQIRLRQVALGVVELPTLLCAACTFHMNVPLRPHKEEPMPRNTVHGGPSNRYDPAVSVGDKPPTAEPGDGGQTLAEVVTTTGEELDVVAFVIGEDMPKTVEVPGEAEVAELPPAQAEETAEATETPAVKKATPRKNQPRRKAQ